MSYLTATHKASSLYGHNCPHVSMHAPTHAAFG